MEGSGIRRFMQGMLLVTVVVLAGCLVTAGAQSARGAVTASSPSAGAPASPTAEPSVTPTVASPTAAPSTASPTTAPSTAATTPSPTPSSSSSSGSGLGGNLVWLWVVLGALVLLGIILLATRSPARGRAPDAVDNWHPRAVDVYAKGAAFDGAVRAAERQVGSTEAASIHWADVQRRADDLTEALYTMRETAPTEHRRVQVENAILSLRAVRDAIDAQRSPADIGPEHGAVLRSRLSTLESSLNTLRVPDDRLG